MTIAAPVAPRPWLLFCCCTAHDMRDYHRLRYRPYPWLLFCCCMGLRTCAL